MHSLRLRQASPAVCPRLWPAVPAAMAILLLAGCANRHPRLVAVEKPYDGQLNCQQLSSEISAAQRLIGSYQTDNAQQSSRNGQAVVGAVLMPVSLMNMDTGDAADQEVNAYSQRIAHLQKLSKEKACS